MRMSYQIVPRDQETQKTARKIVDMLVDSGLTYEKASEALEEAQTLLGKTKPTANPRSYIVQYNISLSLWQVWHNHSVVYEATTIDDAERWASAQG